jgi:hypothetical protein
MDLLPIQPTSSNKVNSAINLANDGGSKSQTGYFKSSGKQKEEEKPHLDEVNFSNLMSDDEKGNEAKENIIVVLLKNIYNKIKNFIKNLFKPKGLTKNIFAQK